MMLSIRQPHASNVKAQPANQKKRRLGNIPVPAVVAAGGPSQILPSLMLAGFETLLALV